MPSVAAYCRATAASPAMSRPAIWPRISVGNVAGSGKPPENVMTSVAPARARMAVISLPPRVRVRCARPALQSCCSRAAVMCLSLSDRPCLLLLASLDSKVYKCKNLGQSVLTLISPGCTIAHRVGFTRWATWQMATSSAPLAKLTEVAAPSSPKVEVDELDLALLRALATDARQSQRALARAVEMSPPAVADRLARLERSGAIRGYRVDVDWAALGFPVVVYLAVTAGPGMDLSEIIRAIRAMPEAQDMSVVTGGLDLLVRLRVRDHEHLRELLLTKIFQINGVQRTETFLSLADVEPDNFTVAMLEIMSQRKARQRT